MLHLPEFDHLVRKRRPRRAVHGKPRPISLLLRYGDSMFGVDTIAEHTDMVKRYGFAWFGKFGTGMKGTRADQIRSQLAEGVPTHLYLWKAGEVSHQATILGVVCGRKNALALAPEPSRVPKYYQDIGCSLWLKIKDIRPIRPAALKSLRLASSPAFRPDLSTTCGLIYVTKALARDG